jgi:hypothetical protein
MNYLTDGSAADDNAFGPETDLVLSLLVIVLLVGVLAWFQGNLLVKKKEEIIRRNERKLVFQERASTFSRGSAEIRPEDERQLRTKVADFEDAIRRGNFEYLEIAGGASPEKGKSSQEFDINLTKGYDRAQAVARILHSAGLPYECMKLSSYGRATSQFLGELIKSAPRDAPINILRDFDSNPAAAAAIEEKVAMERRTEIWGIPPSRKEDGSIELSVCMLLLRSRPQ